MDISAGLIRILEHLGWATGVHWPDPDRLAAHRRNGATGPAGHHIPGIRAEVTAGFVPPFP